MTGGRGGGDKRKTATKVGGSVARRVAEGLEQRKESRSREGARDDVRVARATGALTPLPWHFP